jgi:hypothetical protein
MTESTADLKTCTKCGEAKPRTAYGPHPNTRDKLRTSCKPCNSAQTRAWNKANPGRIKTWNLANRDRVKHLSRRSSYKRRYGITLDQYEQMLADQGGVCTICRRPSVFEYLAVDHDHQTGVIRALLCQHCNAGLGNFRDSPELLAAAAAYLAHFGAWQASRAEDAAGDNRAPGTDA